MDCTVIIATHNRLPFLRRCLECLARQDYPAGQHEVVVVDDGSTDGTTAQLRSQAGAGNVRLVSCRHRCGPAAARNRGLEIARGEIVLFLDDDALAPFWLVREHVRTHRRRRGVFVDGPAITVTHTDVSEFGRVPVRLMAWADFFGRPFVTVNASARLDDLRQCGGFDESMIRWQDTDLERRLRSLGLGRVRNRHAYVLHWKPSPVSMAERLTFEQWNGRWAAAYYRKHPDRRARRQIRQRHLLYDAVLSKLGLAGRYTSGAPHAERQTAADAHGLVIPAFEIIHAYATGLRLGFAQDPRVDTSKLRFRPD